MLQLESLIGYVSTLDHSFYMQDMLMQSLKSFSYGSRINSFSALLQDIDFDATDNAAPKQKLATHLQQCELETVSAPDP